MQLPRYQLKADKSLMVFEFVSEGNKGKIQKLITFNETNLKDLYNLAFGDKNIETGDIDDMAVSNNGDSEMVLATVVATVYAFTDKYPESMIYAIGSTNARTRLYRMGITKYIKEIDKDFDIFGLSDNLWQPFEKDMHYDAFLAKRKKQ
jgi:hypothetical protein